MNVIVKISEVLQFFRLLSFRCIFFFSVFCFSCKKSEYIEFKKVVRRSNDLLTIDKKLNENEIRIVSKLLFENNHSLYIKESSIYFKMPIPYESEELFMWVYTDELNTILKKEGRQK